MGGRGLGLLLNFSICSEFCLLNSLGTNLTILPGNSETNPSCASPVTGVNERLPDDIWFVIILRAESKEL